MKQNELFDLVKSLTKAEKRHFKLTTSKYNKDDGNTYLKLFEVIEKMDSYDERYVKEKFISTNLSYTKNYLYNSILKSLREFHSDISDDARLKDLLREAEILFKKGLYQQCFAHLERSKQEALRYDKFLLLLEILECERKVKLRMESLEHLSVLLEKNHKEEKDVLKKYENLCYFRDLSRRIYLESRKVPAPREQEQLEPFNRIIKDPLLSDESNALSFEAIFNFHNTFSFYYHAISDWEGLYHQRKKVVTLFESRNAREVLGYEGMFIALNNFIVACNGTGKFEEALLAVQKIKDLGAKIPNYKNSVFYTNTFSLELSTLLYQQQFKTALEVVHSFIRNVKLEGENVTDSHRVVLGFCIGYIFFANGNHKEACKWLKKVISIKDKKTRPDILHFAGILAMLIKLEADELEEKHILQAQGSYKKSGDLRAFEKTLIDFLLEYRSTPERKRKNVLNNFKISLEDVFQDPFEQRILQYIDLHSWIESVSSKRPFLEVIADANSTSKFTFAPVKAPVK